MNLVLTDDEIAAAALDRRLAWPAPFPTVVTAVDELAAAAARGRRSLLVRELATPLDVGVAVTAEVVDALERAVGSRCVMAWVASVHEPLRLAGSSTVLYRGSDGDLVDLTSAIGIHDFRTNTADESEALVLAVAKNVFDFGFVGPADPAARLLVGELGAPSVLLVSGGKIESGSWNHDGIQVDGTTTEWDPSLVENVLR